MPESKPDGLRSRALSLLEGMFLFAEGPGRGDPFDRDRRIALYGRVSMAAELGAITADEWEAYYVRLRKMGGG